MQPATDYQRVIAVSDIHLSDSPPPSRTDDWWTVQTETLIWLNDLSCTLKAPVLCAGDIFDAPHRNKLRPSHLLANMFMAYAPSPFYFVAGQHDLPSHNIETAEETALWGMHKLKRIQWLHGISTLPNGLVVAGFSWAESWDKPLNEPMPNIILAHRMCWYKESPYPGAPESSNVKHIAKEVQAAGGTTLICGDNHVPFCTTSKRSGITICNPGSLFQLTAAQQNHRPRVYLLTFNDGKFVSSEALYAPHAGPECISRVKIERAKEHKTHLEAFVQSLAEGGEIGLSFEHNIKQEMEANRMRRNVRAKVLECLETTL